MGYLKEVNIKSDMPTVAEAEKRLEAAISSGKKLGSGAVKIIHGYGSGGKGGKIRIAVRKKASEMGKTIILVTHQMDHVLTYTNRALVFQNALLKCDMTPLELFNNLDLVKSLEIKPFFTISFNPSRFLYVP